MKKFKSIWMSILIVMLSVAMILGSFTFSASAASGGTELYTGKLPDKVVYGTSVDNIPTVVSGGSLKVFAPSGTEVTSQISNNSLEIKEVGSYSFTYASAGASYTFNVYSYVKEDYSIKVGFNGADIPTFIKKSTKFTIPTAKVVYYDKDGVMQETSFPVKVSYGLTKDASAATAIDVTPDASGIYYIKYHATVPTATTDGTKILTKDFEVKVQDEFTDNAAPTISIVNVPTDVSINKKVTIPVATPTDDFDTNIKVTVKVTYTNESGEVIHVKETTEDENGFAKPVADNANDVAFDNDKVMSFYATREGDYKVTYIATDDTGKTSGEQDYPITCADKASPIFQKVDDYTIPTTWGKTVNDKNGVVSDDSIAFPMPVVIDNAGNDNIKVSFKITSSKDKSILVEFKNIFGAAGDDETKYSKSGVDYVFDKTMSEFKYSFKALATGDYVAEYKAKDKNGAGNSATKSYKIVLESEFTDKENPTTAELDTPKYLLSGTDEEFTIPLPKVSDKLDTRLKVDYSISNGTNEITVKGGEKATLKDDKFKIVNKAGDGAELDISSATTLIFKLKATDNMGYFKENKEAVTGNDLNIVDLINTATAINPTLNTADIEAVYGGTSTTNTDLRANEVVKLGSFVVSAADKYRDYIGFEISVNDENGKALTGVELLTLNYIDNQTAYVKAQDIKFTPQAAGDYTLTIRALSVSGHSKVAVHKFTVNPAGPGGPGTSAVSIPTNGAYGAKYSIRNYKISNIGETGKTYYATHKIIGGKFSLMGSEFTGYSLTTYSFYDGYVEKGANAGDFDRDNIVSAEDGTYSLAVTDSNKPVIELLGVIDSYKADKNVAVTIPNAIGANKIGNAKIEVKVSSKHGGANVTKKADGSGYEFTPEFDGKYTIVYTATSNNEPQHATFYMNVGDVVGPQFTLSGTHSGSALVNGSFKFMKVTATAETHEDAKKFTYTKKLIDPANEEVQGTTISGVGTEYADKENQGTTIKYSKSGTYTVVYEVEDEVGNVTTLKYTISVSAKSSGTPASMTALSTVLIIVGVLLLIGAIVYAARFRKVKK